ncbi:hypothetical protein L218DRAFT_1009091 [Marasmius fiardii PR-910]|nr:hypothetical protein L218DRAFT_1009091 [Marasmius fiardii PR-910]
MPFATTERPTRSRKIKKIINDASLRLTLDDCAHDLPEALVSGSAAQTSVSLKEQDSKPKRKVPKLDMYQSPARAIQYSSPSHPVLSLTPKLIARLLQRETILTPFLPPIMGSPVTSISKPKISSPLSKTNMVRVLSNGMARQLSSGWQITEIAHIRTESLESLISSGRLRDTSNREESGNDGAIMRNPRAFATKIGPLP